MSNIQNGAIADPRPLSEQQKDHLHENLFSGLPVHWIEKPRATWALAHQRNQDGSFSCVKQASETAKEKIINIVTSAMGYQFRAAGKGSEGMYLQNCGDIDYNIGTVMEIDAPSQNMDDPHIDAIVPPKNFTVKITGYRTFALIDIELIAEAIQAYGQCLLIFSSNIEEWDAINQTPVYNGQTITFGHGICAVDFTLINGIKTLVCMDSAGQWSSPNGVRLITQDFLNARCKGAMYYLGAFVLPIIAPIIPVQVPVSPLGGLNITKPLSYGSIGIQVFLLQNRLIQDAVATFFMPTGLFGNATKQSLIAYQARFSLPQSGYCDTLTLAHLQKWG